MFSNKSLLSFLLGSFNISTPPFQKFSQTPDLKLPHIQVILAGTRFVPIINNGLLATINLKPPLFKSKDFTGRQITTTVNPQRSMVTSHSREGREINSREMGFPSSGDKNPIQGCHNEVSLVISPSVLPISKLELHKGSSIH